MSEFNYDTSGSQVEFKAAEKFMVFEEHQLIHLKNPAFYKLTKSGDVMPRLYYIDDSGEEVDIAANERDDTFGWNKVAVQTDTQAKADALMVNMESAGPAEYAPEFVSQIRVNLIGTNTIKGQISSTGTIVYVEYQLLAKAKVDYVAYDGNGPRYSPSLIQDILDRVALLEDRGATKSMFGVPMVGADMLNEDLTGAAPENYVQLERHTINYRAGINTIAPARGAFYDVNLQVYSFVGEEVTITAVNAGAYLGKTFIYNDVRNAGTIIHTASEFIEKLTDDNIEKFYGITGTVVDLNDPAVKVLTRGVDYEVSVPDISRSERSSSVHGVYQNITFLKNVATDVLISYQAFGGQAMQSDIRVLQHDLENTRATLEGVGFVTGSSLHKQPFLVDIHKRLLRIEEYNAHYSQVEHNVHTGQSGFHWFNIAYLHDVHWGKLKDAWNELGQFRIHSALRKWTYDFAVTVDMARKGDEILQIRTVASNEFNAYDSNDYARVINRDGVCARLCWINDGATSGIVLQIGWNFNHYSPMDGVDTDTILVTNKSTNASAWKLFEDVGDRNYPTAGKMQVYQHTKYKKTTDATFLDGKQYFQYIDKYTYYRSTDTVIKAGVEYFQLVDDAFVGITPEVGSTTDVFRVIIDGEPVLNLFTRDLYARIPTKAVVVAGGAVTGEYYEVDTTAIDDSTAFTMPNPTMIWYKDSVTSNKAVRMIEPENGVIAWLGNVPLAKYAAGINAAGSVFETQTLISKVVQQEFNPTTIKGIDVVFYDRRDHKFVLGSCKCMPGEDEAYGEMMFCMEDLCAAKFSICREAADGKQWFVIKMNVYCGTSSKVNDRFDMRQIRFRF